MARKKPPSKKKAADTSADTPYEAVTTTDSPAIPDEHPEAQVERKELTEAEILTEARERLDICIAAESTNRERALEDVQFRDGNQWPADVVQERKAENRPCLTINRCEDFIDHIMGDIRQNSVSIKVRPIQLGHPAIAKPPSIPNLASDKSYELSQVYEGIIRDIESRSTAQTMYDMAADHAVGHGFGYLRVITSYVEDDTFDQEILIRAIRNSFCCYPDPMAQMPLKQDMRFALISAEIPRKEFKRRWPHASTGSDLSQGPGEVYANWFMPDNIRVAEYFRRVMEPVKLCLLSDGRVVEEEKYDKLKDELAKQNITKTKSRDAYHSKVEWRLITGTEVLDGPVVFPSKYIPIVPVYGKELNVNGETIYRGAIRHMKDPARLYNYWRSAGAEQVALAPKAPYTIADKQVEGYEDIWKTANTKNHAYLPYKYVANLPPPMRTQPIPVNPGVSEQQMVAIDDMHATAGLREPALGIPSNEKSGKAIMARQQAGQKSTFAYPDNLARSVEHVGRIIVDMIPRVYDGERIVRMQFIDGTEDFVRINQVVIDQQTGREIVLHNIAAGRYEVKADVGPAYVTQRQEAAESMIAFMDILPDALKMVMAPFVARNMDWAGADEISRVIKAAMPPELRQAIDAAENEAEQPDGGPDPAALMAALQQMAQRSQLLEQAFSEMQAKLQTKDDELVRAKDSARLAEHRRQSEQIKGLMRDFRNLMAKAQVSTASRQTQSVR